ncbi:uncharacterized protein [Littorina saxatilis]|uniref:uncharacterized protein isoform X2 n=1 Tax=Littorina saxatilis TaxID=31220 RepID=UPI0038B5A511
MPATRREPAVTSFSVRNPKVTAGSESARLSACSESIMPKECTAADCNEQPKKGSGISFHSFPKESHLLQQWLVKMNRFDPNTKKLWKPNQHDSLCSRHFLSTDFTMRTQISRQEGLPYKPMLRPDAVPTIFDHSQEVRKRATMSSERRTAFIKRRRKEVLSDILEPETADSPQAQEELFQEDPTSDEEQSDRHSVSVQTELLTQKDKGNQTHSYRQMVNVSQQTIDVSVPEIVAPQKLTTSIEACKTPAFSNAESQTYQIRHVVSNEDSESDDEVTADLSDQEEDNTEYNRGESTQHNKPHTLTEDLNHVDAFGETKYLVFESNLEELLSVCRRCSKICQVTRKGVEGTAVEYTCLCEHCSHNYTWCSQPYSKRLPLGNLVLAAAAFFTACSPSRLITLFKSCNICIFGKTTYNNLQSAYMVQAVRNVWTRCQERLFAARPRTRPLKLAGDGRCDSPGHCAKYGSYTFLDATTMEVLHIELIQSNMVKNSHAMELEGLKRGLNALKANVKVSHLVTDRHVQIKSHMAKNEVEITHRFDIWHMAKGVGKKLDAASNKAGYSALGLWTKSIKNHLYYCAQSTPESPRRVEVVKAKWKSVVNHVSNQHKGHGDDFPDCLHGDLSNEPRAWIRKAQPLPRSSCQFHCLCQERWTDDATSIGSC